MYKLTQLTQFLFDPFFKSKVTCHKCLQKGIRPRPNGNKKSDDNRTDTAKCRITLALLFLLERSLFFIYNELDKLDYLNLYNLHLSPDDILVRTASASHVSLVPLLHRPIRVCVYVICF
jgi:hypothetical protein